MRLRGFDGVGGQVDLITSCLGETELVGRDGRTTGRVLVRRVRRRLADIYQSRIRWLGRLAWIGPLTWVS